MSIIPRPFPAALPHGELREILPNIFFVTGTIELPGPVSVRFSRNMIVVRVGERLVLVNTVRLDDAGLAELDKLGKVTDIIRVAANHGMDDPFYADRYQAKTHVIRGQRYTAGFDTKAENTYFAPDAELDADSPLPIAGASVHIFRSDPPEALLVLDRPEGGVAIAGDSLQHIEKADPYFNFLGRTMLKLMGFIKPYQVGPGWLKSGKPPASDLEAILDLPIEHVLPSHGSPVLGNAKEKFRASITAVSGAIAKKRAA